MHRFAIYYTPPQDHPLTRLAASWLGRDAFAGEAVPQPRSGHLTAEELAFHTAPARRYGFHATMQAPFRLAERADEGALTSRLDAFCSEMQPFVVRLALRRLDGFFALMAEQPSQALDQLARDVVVAFDDLRAPLSDAEIERRNPDSLTPLQLRYLHQWGYPYVFEEFRFHMTLTGRVGEEDARRVRAAIEAHFGAVLDQPVEIGSLAVFAEANPGAPFSVHAFSPFRQKQRKTA